VCPEIERAWKWFRVKKSSSFPNEITYCSANELSEETVHRCRHGAFRKLRLIFAFQRSGLLPAQIGLDYLGRGLVVRHSIAVQVSQDGLSQFLPEEAAMELNFYLRGTATPAGIATARRSGSVTRRARARSRSPPPRAWLSCAPGRETCSSRRAARSAAARSPPGRRARRPRSCRCRKT